MMIKLTTTAIASLMTVLPQCDAPQPPVRPAQTIFVGEVYPLTFHAENGDTVNLIMNDDSEEIDELNRCEASGGTLERNEFTDILICYDIDF